MAIRRLRIRRCYCLGLDGNLQLPSESLCVAFAYTHSDSHSHCNCYANRNGDAYCYRRAEVYSITEAASYAAAATVTFNGT
jgi:hypothetical protein